MSKRRTKKQKAGAHHQFSISWNSTHVNRQFTKRPVSSNSHSPEKENADVSASNPIDQSSIKDIFRSLILASIIIGLELVIYFAWSFSS